ncbi:MAG: type I restriction endonuclease [Methanocorpusculum sp.]|nr:type I restriction endonuclease [Methanocorpusculum sp.]
MPVAQDLSEEEVKLRYITPAITETAGWNRDTQVRMEYQFTDGMVLVRDGGVTRGKQKKADYLLSYNGIPLAIVEAKKLSCSLGTGMQQALEYAGILDVPFVYASNGEGFLEHDRFAEQNAERELKLDEFPTPDALWKRYCLGKELGHDEERKITVPYYYEVGG